MRPIDTKPMETECSHTCFLCRSVHPEWLELIQLKRKMSYFDKDSFIFRIGEPVTGIYLVLEGKVKVEMPLGENRFILRLSSNGDILGHRGMGMDNLYSVQAVALEPTTLCFIPLGFFFKLLKTNPDFHFSLTFFLAEELKNTERRMANLICMPVKARIAEAILMIREVFGSDKIGALKFPLGRNDMASIAGTDTEALNQSLNELVEEKLITLVGRNIIVKNVSVLEDYFKAFC